MVSVLRAHVCIQVTDNHGEVSHLPLAEGTVGAMLVVKVLLLFFLSVMIIVWSIGLNGCGVLTRTWQ